MALRDFDKELADRIESLRRERGEMVSVADVAGIVESLLSVSGSGGPGLRLYGELASLADYIHTARAEIAALHPEEIRTDFIPTATDELDAIVGATETATNLILDACEHIESLAPVVDPSVAERLTDITTEIYQACNFQDLTGQRITKVVKVLKTIEERISTLVKVFGEEVAGATAPVEKAILSDEDLLNGPQLPGNATDQAEIDRLLAGLD